MITPEAIAAEVQGMEGWADISVHPSNSKVAMKAAQAHNDTEPRCQVRVTFSVLLGREEFGVKQGNYVEKTKKRGKYGNR